MSYSQLHMLLEDNIIHETKGYMLARLHECIYIKIKVGVQTCYNMGVRTTENKYTTWMSIPYAKTQLFWFNDSIQKVALQGINKAVKLNAIRYNTAC